jgi:pimeloyl-ACP methyl ester carboxylesterase
VITGSDDAVVPPEWSHNLAAAWGTDPVVIPEAGHCPHVTHPGIVGDLITDFTERLQGSSAAQTAQTTTTTVEVAR